MDFHACFEVCLGGQWSVIDPTDGIAPENPIVIARGRAAANAPRVTIDGRVLSGIGPWISGAGIPRDQPGVWRARWVWGERGGVGVSTGLAGGFSDSAKIHWPSSAADVSLRPPLSMSVNPVRSLPCL